LNTVWSIEIHVENLPETAVLASASRRPARLVLIARPTGTRLCREPDPAYDILAARPKDWMNHDRLEIALGRRLPL
jgi:hypothetical protein